MVFRRRWQAKKSFSATIGIQTPSTGVPRVSLRGAQLPLNSGTYERFRARMQRNAMRSERTAALGAAREACVDALWVVGWGRAGIFHGFRSRVRHFRLWDLG